MGFMIKTCANSLAGDAWGGRSSLDEFMRYQRVYQREYVHAFFENKGFQGQTPGPRSNLGYLAAIGPGAPPECYRSVLTPKGERWVRWKSTVGWAMW